MIPVLDINTASLEDLCLLRGVGVVRARRIIRGRPYEDTYALVSRGLLSEASYDRNVQYLAVARANGSGDSSLLSPDHLAARSTATTSPLVFRA